MRTDVPAAPAASTAPAALAALIADAASEVLGVPVTATTDLPAAGLDLAPAIRLATWARRELALRLTVADLYSGRTPRRIADGLVPAQAAAHGDEDPCPLVRVPLDGGERIWHQEGPLPAGRPSATTSLLYLGIGEAEVDPGRLGTALTRIVASQEALRTVPGHGGGPPEVLPWPSPAKVEVAVTEVPDAGWEALQQALDLAAKDALAGFDIENGPLLRCALFTWNGGRLLALQLHRSVLDPWSRESFEHLVEAGYAAGEAAPAAPVRHAAAESWQPADAASLERAEFWSRSQTAASALVWPAEAEAAAADRPAAAEGSAPSPVHEEIKIDPALLAALTRRAEASGAGLTAVILTAYAQALAEFTQVRDFSVGVWVPRRVEAWQDGALGHHTSLVPVRIRLRDGARESIDETVRRCNEALLWSAEHHWVRSLTVRADAADGREPLLRATLCVEPATRAGALRLGSAVLEPARLPHAAASDELTAELLRPSGHGGQRQLLLTADPARLSQAEIRLLAQRINAAIAELARGHMITEGS
jgi:hypothetical protein